MLILASLSSGLIRPIGHYTTTTFQEDHVDLTEDFQKMLDEGYWEKEGNGEDVVVK